MDAAHLFRDDVIVHDARRMRTWWSRGPIADYRFEKYLVDLIETDCPDVFIVDHRKYNYLFANLKRRYDIRVINRIGTIISWRLRQTGRNGEFDTARRLLPCSDAIVVPSTLAKEDLVESFHIDERKITVIYNALDCDKLSRYSAEELDYQSEAKILLFVGALDQGKSPGLLLEAFRDLTRVNDGLELWFVGDGDERRSLQKYVQDHDLTSSVRFWGWQSNPYKFFKRADVFVHTSQMDGFGIALMEAAYFNLPIVYSEALVGANELLKKHRIGYPFDLRSKRDLVATVRAALEQPRKKCFASLEADVSIDRFIQQMEAVIDETLA